MKVRVPVLVTVACGSAAIAACGDDELNPLVTPPAPPTALGAIAGRVCDFDTGAWVAGATAELPVGNEVRSQVTDAEGRFTFSELQPGAYTVHVVAPGLDERWTTGVTAGVVAEVGPETCEPPPVQPEGGVQGRICGAEGYWLSGARVFIVLGSGQVVETNTDGQGHYLLTGVPDGTHTVQVTRGSFSTSFPVTVSNGQVTVLPDPVCIPPTTQMAVVTGIYDKVQNVLTGLSFVIRRGYDPGGTTEHDANGNIDLIEGDDSAYWLEEFLTDPAWMAQYDIIFFNCGPNDDPIFFGDSVVDTAAANLKAFVQAGGSVYASDWASEILRITFPDRINFLGSDSAFGAARLGISNPALPATVVDNGLATALGRTALNLNLNLDIWVVLETLANQPVDLRVLVLSEIEHCNNEYCMATSTQANSPLVVRFDDGLGRVLFTSAHNEAQTTQDLRDVLNYIIFEL